MLADRQTHTQTHRQTDRQTDRNTPLPYRGGVIKRRATSRLRGTVVERRSLAGEISLSCVRLAADG